MGKEKTYTEQDLQNAFEESRLTHPMIGFKHKDFNEYKESLPFPHPLPAGGKTKDVGICPSCDGKGVCEGEHFDDLRPCLTCGGNSHSPTAVISAKEFLKEKGMDKYFFGLPALLEEYKNQFLPPEPTEGREEITCGRIENEIVNWQCSEPSNAGKLAKIIYDLFASSRQIAEKGEKNPYFKMLQEAEGQVQKLISENKQLRQALEINEMHYKESQIRPEVKLPSDSGLDMKYPCTEGDSVVMEENMTYGDTLKANYYRKQGAKWLRDEIKKQTDQK